MKKIYKYILMTVLAFGYSSCSDEFLEFVPEDQATVNSWYRNEEEILQSTATLYGRPWWGFTDVFQWCTGDLLPGDMYHTWEAEGEYFKNSFGSGNQHLLDGWRGLYNVISYANLIIDDMPGIAGGYGVGPGPINQALAEARFFRAVGYFYLVEHWGAVPIIESPAARVAANDLTPPKHRVQDVYEFIRRDLVFAAETLAPSNEAGRVTSWAAKGMLAKLHVTLGQGAVGGAGFGTMEDFTTAANYARDIYQNSGRTLAGSYEELFKVANENDPEILWAIQCINNGWSTGSSRQARFGRHTAVTGDGTAWGDGKCPTLSFINNLESNAEGETDLRRRAIFMEQGDTYDYLATENGGYTYTIVYRDEDGAQLNGASASLTAVKKNVIGNAADMGYTITNQDSPMDLFMLRLSDVYLILAEAELGAGSLLTGGDGLTALNLVRQRAGLEPRTQATYEQIMNERRVEFGFESQSWIDMKRRYYRDPSGTLAYLNTMGRAARYQAELDVALDQQAQENDPNGYVLVYSTSDATNPATIPPGAYLGTWPAGDEAYTEAVNAFTSANDLLLPIPSTEVLVNPNLAQGAEPATYIFE